MPSDLHPLITERKFYFTKKIAHWDGSSRFCFTIVEFSEILFLDSAKENRDFFRGWNLTGSARKWKSSLFMELKCIKINFGFWWNVLYFFKLWPLCSEKAWDFLFLWVHEDDFEVQKKIPVTKNWCWEDLEICDIDTCINKYLFAGSKLIHPVLMTIKKD